MIIVILWPEWMISFMMLKLRKFLFICFLCWIYRIFTETILKNSQFANQLIQKTFTQKQSQSQFHCLQLISAAADEITKKNLTWIFFFNLRMCQLNDFHSDVNFMCARQSIWKRTSKSKLLNIVSVSQNILLLW